MCYLYGHTSLLSCTRSTTHQDLYPSSDADGGAQPRVAFAQASCPRLCQTRCLLPCTSCTTHQGIYPSSSADGGAPPYVAFVLASCPRLCQTRCLLPCTSCATHQVFSPSSSADDGAPPRVAFVLASCSLFLWDRDDKTLPHTRCTALPGGSVSVRRLRRHLNVSRETSSHSLDNV